VLAGVACEVFAIWPVAELDVRLLDRQQPLAQAGDKTQRLAIRVNKHHDNVRLAEHIMRLKFEDNACLKT
jgi:hypothetical protein